MIPYRTEDDYFTSFSFFLFFNARSQRWCYSCPSIRATHSKRSNVKLPPTRVFLVVASSPHSQRHLSSSTFKYFNLHESQYPRREQAGRFSRSQFESGHLLNPYPPSFFSPAPICSQVREHNIHRQVGFIGQPVGTTCVREDLCVFCFSSPHQPYDISMFYETRAFIHSHTH